MRLFILMIAPNSRLATHLVTMSMETFNILAQSLAPDDVNLVIVANTGRSGSTLLAQMFESIKGELWKIFWNTRQVDTMYFILWHSFRKELVLYDISFCSHYKIYFFGCL